MNVDLPARAARFRDELRQWLDEHTPPSGTFTGREDGRIGISSPGMEAWTAKLEEARLLCVSWPEEFGGRGLGAIEVAVLNEEFARAGVPRVQRGMGENLVGPSIIAHGTDEQKAYFLPRIISGDDRYCQGFSEPDAGSDLASLQTRGVRDGDELVVSGQKVWTSWYIDANMLFCLCRTDLDAPKHRGISYVLLPVDNNGIEFRPLRQLNGEEHFAETFLTGARAPMFNVIGGLGEGWRVAMTTLGNERGGSATTQHLRFRAELDQLIDEAKQRGRSREAVVRQDLAWAYTQVEIMRFSGLRQLAALADERSAGPQSSIHKMFWSEYHRRFGEIALAVRGMDATIRPDGDSYALDGWQQAFFTSRSETIWGGTAEVQRNIVGERVLGLPKEPVGP